MPKPADSKTALNYLNKIEQAYCNKKLAATAFNSRNVRPVDVHNSLRKEFAKCRDEVIRQRIIDAIKHPNYRLCPDTEIESILEKTGMPAERSVSNRDHPLPDQHKLPPTSPEGGKISEQAMASLYLRQIEQAYDNNHSADKAFPDKGFGKKVHQCLMRALKVHRSTAIGKRILRVIKNSLYTLCSLTEKKDILNKEMRRELFLHDTGGHRRKQARTEDRNTTKLSSGITVIDVATESPVTPDTSVHKVKSALQTPVEKIPDRLEPAKVPATEVTREHMGGKGLFLTKMQEAGLPVPPFKAIGAPLLAKFEQRPISPELLKRYIPDIDTDLSSPLSLAQIKQKIGLLPSYKKDERNQWLEGLNRLITSDDFLALMTGLPEAADIRNSYQQLRQLHAGSAFIVRSSGVKEDGYGDAQAGKYDSHVHGEGDILKTCLKVMASGYRPEVCPEGVPQPMAMVIQQCIDCRFGGVAISHTSLQDDTIQVEYVPGQPKGAVAGQYGVTPHRYAIKRKDDKHEYEYERTRGDIPAHFVLSKTGDGFTETEQKSTNALQELLPKDAIKKLHDHIQLLENQLGCPVDVEFAIDQQGKLYLVQVRPVTRLVGGARFSGNKPENPIVDGALVSEGCCSGVAVAVDHPIKPEQLPRGAIVYAANGADWMLDPEFLKQAGGFVFQHGGTNDHVAITLRQAGKPCLLAGSQFDRLKGSSPKQVTLVAGSFAGASGAYLLAGDQTEAWQARRSSLTRDYSEALEASKAYKKRSVTFQRVDQGFQWLNQQNDRLLGYFQSDRLLHLCLSPEQSKALSMSPQRVEVLKQLEEEVKHLVEDADAFVTGYEQFLEMAGGSDDETIANFRKEIEPLKRQLASIKAQVSGQVQAIAEAMMSGREELPEQSLNFRQWLKDCTQLKDDLQKLGQPDHPGGIASIHDLIYFIHKRFIEALAPVAEGSEQGQRKTINDHTKRIDFTNQSSGLLNKDCQEALENFDAPETVCLNLPTACLVNARLGVHACRIEMFEQAEGGKGRKLRLTLSDDFKKAGAHNQGKLKRFWFLVQSLRAMSLSENSAGMSVYFNEAAGSMVIECSHMRTREDMQNGFVKLMSVMPTLRNFDLMFEDEDIDGNGLQWDFKMLEKKCQEVDGAAENDLAFKYCLMLIARDCEREKSIDMNPLSDGYLTKLNAKDRFIHDTSVSIRKQISKNDLDGVFEKIQSLAGSNKDDLLLHVMAIFPSSLPQLLQNNKLNGLIDANLAIRLCRQNGKVFQYLPEALRNDREVFLTVVNTFSDALGYAGEDIKRDIGLVTKSVENFPDALKHAGHFRDSEELIKIAVEEKPAAFEHARMSDKNNKELFMKLIKTGVDIFKYLSPDLKNDKEVVMVAARHNYLNLTVAGDEIKNDEEAMREMINALPICRYYIGESLKGNTDYILDIIRLYPDIYYAIESKLQQDPQILQSVAKVLSTRKEELLNMLEFYPEIFPYLSQELQNDPVFRKAAGQPEEKS